MAERKQIDWEKVRIQYSAGVLSLREIAEENGVSHTMIRKKAAKENWPRYLSEKINKAGKELVIIPQVADEFEREGFVYVVYLDDSAKEIFYKIGMTKSFTPRLMAHQCASPFSICVACAFFVGNMRYEEKRLHELFKEKKVRGEWFRLEDSDLAEIAQRAILI